MEWYVNVNGKKLKRGFTTGTAATAALKASVLFNKYNIKPDNVNIELPNGELINIPIYKYEIISGLKYAFVKKDAGDDADITNQCLIYCSFKYENLNNIIFDSYEGVGKITKDGLDISKGEFAINPIPREMMKKVLNEENIKNGRVIVNVKNGEILAKKTLNENLGIIDGISILGTTGIVEPMNENAWKESLIPHISIVSKQFDTITLLLGGKGLSIYKKYSFFKEDYILCGNHIGYSIEKSLEMGIKKIHILGSFQKLIKLAGLNLNTDSRYTDSKNELLALLYILFTEKYDKEVIDKILNLKTIYNFLDILKHNDINIKKFFIFVSEYISHKLSNKFNAEFVISLCDKTQIISHRGDEQNYLYFRNTDQ
ncbi:cobalt-precorrin-5B (C(1))-methyltransferase CbiD [Oceanotoga teriensis]|jgi:cobalt-precorrin-5B (C1)-methyltransferase|uniref:cobalt-precorrin-5B (C(1))-methyltransferase CbiD n=1 Tax=Oceanotoga teriensis TaxID=515440 RepID=UPI002712BC7C|nr:cobalt-precorrin-5B (C(1))-methyltransferase CbiD [Oceanotoga teriensis]MDO7975329.1 cobalt-precorrin-5B (C(1))-methyltransferase CbiD [Oceanotoga teriensis]